MLNIILTKSIFQLKFLKILMKTTIGMYGIKYILAPGLNTYILFQFCLFYL